MVKYTEKQAQIIADKIVSTIENYAICKDLEFLKEWRHFSFWHCVRALMTNSWKELDVFREQLIYIPEYFEIDKSEKYIIQNLINVCLGGSYNE